jgi:hypothetical protein
MSLKKQYRIGNWKKYNQALVNRGSITFWLDDEAIKKWYESTKASKRGRPFVYSNIAIICALTLRALFHLPLRATEGFLISLINLLKMTIDCPDYSTLCRRQKHLVVNLPRTKTRHEKATHVVFDATGLKVFGEGEWKVRQHGYSKRRTWRKLTLLLDAENQEIMSAVLSTNDYNDKELLPELLADVEEKLGNAAGDSGYDSHDNFNLLATKGAVPLIPPRQDAKIRYHGKSEITSPRDDVIRKIKHMGRKRWKQVTNYHQRSLVETAMFRLKRLLGGHLSNHRFEHQATEAFIRCRALNLITQMGMPESYIVS